MGMMTAVRKLLGRDFEVTWVVMMRTNARVISGITLVLALRLVKLLLRLVIMVLFGRGRCYWWWW